MSTVVIKSAISSTIRPRFLLFRHGERFGKTLFSCTVMAIEMRLTVLLLQKNFFKYYKFFVEMET